MIYSNTSLVHLSNFVAVIAFCLHVFNMHWNKKNTASHVLKLFLTGKWRLHEVTCQPQSLGSFAFWKVWIGGKESAFKETRKEP